MVQAYGVEKGWVQPGNSPMKALTEYVARAIGRELPREVMEKARIHILDTIAACVSGMALDAGLQARRYVDAFMGPAQATVVASSLRTSMPYAALANGMAAHADETDDSLAPLGQIRTHPGCSIIPSAVAVAEAEGRSGEELMRAVALGYDICGRITMALWSDIDTPHLEQSSAAVGGLFGSAAAAGALLGLDAQQCRHLLSYAVQQSSGLSTFFRGRQHVEKAFVFAGMPAFNGTMVATMVKAGWTGVEDVFIGRPSFFTLGPRPDPDQLTDGLGERYDLLRTKLKKYPAGSPLQSPLDALLMLLDEERLVAREVQSLVVKLSPPRLQTCYDRDMSDLNVEYLIHVALHDGGITLDSAHDQVRFEQWRAQPRDARIKVVGDESLGVSHSASVALVTVDGRKFDRFIKEIPGSPANPLSLAVIEAKARGLLEPTLGEERTVGLVRDMARLEELDRVADLMSWLQVADSDTR
ncbi:MAG TPA: MmgE/PrpD family protein [Nocardioidaceae bacterium]|nr:MmgE/PrpD family protein [Nocardioidaceae bacterium]